MIRHHYSSIEQGLVQRYYTTMGGKIFLISHLKSVLTKFIKGQLISKCPDEKLVSSKIPTKIFLEFCPEIFCSFLRASWKLFGLSGDLVSNVINKEGYRKLKKPQKATKNFRAEIQKYLRWYFG